MQAALSQALALESEGQLSEADQLYRQILSAEPKNGVAIYRRAVLASQRNEHDKAIRLLQSALQHVPENIRDRVNNDFGLIMRKNGEFAFEACRMKEAVESFEAATRFNPADANAHFSEAVCRLTLGDYARGWPKYEWRWKAYGDEPHSLGVARAVWTGEPLEGKSILITFEQGFGDTVMFVRYARLLAQRGAKVMVAVPAPLRAIVGTVEGIEVVQDGDQFARPDYQCSMLDLPLLAKTDLSTIPGDVPYLHTIASYDEKWRGALPHDKVLSVGLVWSGSLEFPRDDKRSLKFVDFAPLLDIPDVQFVSLQREVREHDSPALAARPDVLHFGERLNEFADTASIIAQLDLVIAADSVVANLAGALGKPFWVLIPYVPDFRWLLKRTDSPWYPTATLFRQKRPGDWQDVIARLKVALEKRVADQPA